MIVRTNPSWHCANHTGKCKMDPGSLMTPAAIHGKRTRDWDVPLLCKRTGCSPLVVGEVQLHFLCSGLYLVAEEQGCDSLWAGKERGRDDPQQAQGKDCLSQKVGIPPSLQQCPLWGQRISKAHREQWCCYLPPPKRSYWELQMARELLYWKYEWLSSGVKVSIFVFWPQWFGSHPTAWIIQKCASAGKASYATLAFQILNWKIYIKHAEVQQYFWIFFVFVSRHGWKGRIVKWWKVSPVRPFLSNWIKYYSHETQPRLDFIWNSTK